MYLVTTAPIWCGRDSVDVSAGRDITALHSVRSILPPVGLLSETVSCSQYFINTTGKRPERILHFERLALGARHPLVTSGGYWVLPARQTGSGTRGVLVVG